MSSNRSHNEHPCVLDLFSGAGGLSLGAARAGFSVRGAVELDPHAMAAHRVNFPNTIHVEKDIAGLSGRELMEIIGLSDQPVDGIIGGPPCQGFSCIGANDAGDPRNGLFIHFFRIVREIMPRFFVAENVPGLMAERNGSIRDAAFGRLGGQYTVLPPMKVAASDYGAPTTRARFFFVGFRNDAMKQLGTEDFSPPKSAEAVRVRDALAGLPTKISPLWQSAEDGWREASVIGTGYFHSRLQGHIPDGVGNAEAIRRLRSEGKASGSLGTVHSAEVARRYANIRAGMCDPVSKSRRLDPDGFCPTLRAGTGPERGSYQAVRPLHPTENRVITPREAARLQGFPDWFQFAPTKWHSFRQIGNSVSPILAERLLAVIRHVAGESRPQRRKNVKR